VQKQTRAMDRRFFSSKLNGACDFYFCGRVFCVSKFSLCFCFRIFGLTDFDDLDFRILMIFGLTEFDENVCFSSQGMACQKVNLIHQKCIVMEEMFQYDI
jgi:hypothetical protein